MATLTGIDHIHVYVPDREQAARWFYEVLGFRVEESLRVWAVDGGPLTISDPAGQIHLALFEKSDFVPSTAIAFAADAKNFLEWKQLFECKGIPVRCTDHNLAWSLYLHDPYENLYEITSYDHADISTALKA